MVIGFMLICSTMFVEVKASSFIWGKKKMMTLTSCKKCEDKNYLLHTLCVTIEAMQILSEAFPDLMDSKEVI
jgi:hypothetical protein